MVFWGWSETLSSRTRRSICRGHSTTRTKTGVTKHVHQNAATSSSMTMSNRSFSKKRKTITFALTVIVLILIVLNCHVFWSTLPLAIVASTTESLPTTFHTNDNRSTGNNNNNNINDYQNTLYNESYLYEQACDRPLTETVRSKWKMIDETLQDRYPDARVSGGIFLYPRQASLLRTLFQEILTRIVDDRNRPITLCETGFGSGHSMALFMDTVTSSQSLMMTTKTKTKTTKANTKQNDHRPVHILSFDKFDRPYQLDLWKTLNDTVTTTTTMQTPGLPNNVDDSERLPSLSLRYVIGNSCQTVPSTLSQDPTHQWCDILHGSSLCPSDNIDLVEHSPCGTLLTSTAMLALDDRAVYFGPQAQWRKLRDRECITTPICFQEAPLELERNFIFGKKGNSFSSVFCIAMVTGNCSLYPPPPSTIPTTIESSLGSSTAITTASSSCPTDLYSVLSTMRLEKFCPKYQIPVPS